MEPLLPSPILISVTNWRGQSIPTMSCTSLSLFDLVNYFSNTVCRHYCYIIQSPTQQIPWSTLSIVFESLTLMVNAKLNSAKKSWILLWPYPQWRRKFLAEFAMSSFALLREHRETKSLKGRVINLFWTISRWTFPHLLRKSTHTWCCHSFRQPAWWRPRRRLLTIFDWNWNAE